ncbi:transcription repressor OFP13-like [Salvia hispanica]|uniref:transcription repressor OFP13-like n=1 Tax=Salvia hispanica TaxID=49212 RepID=UPI0020096AAC|nr:transcription repressor OFP13-like [Salvia hispanica]
MSKKMKMPSLFKYKNPKQPWQWPSCNNPATLSFRASNDDVFKTVNSVFLDTSDGLDTPDSWFTNSSECASTTFSTDDHSEENNNDNKNKNDKALEMIIRDVRRSSERLFFEPGDTSSSILLDKEPETTKKAAEALLPFEESVALAMESEDPYMDFRKSMQEMVETHGLEEWDRLEELLGWYLRMNSKQNHGFIVGAFVDLLVGTAKDPSTAIYRSDSTSYSSADSCFSSPPSPVSCRDRVGGGGDAINVQS